MGLLNRFSSSNKRALLSKLPSGSFTMDRDGHVVASTLPCSFPDHQMHAIGQVVLKTFRGAHQANVHLTELSVHYAAFKLTARELRGGAVIFLAPRTTGKTQQI
jgi:hypothetical protein